MRRLTRRGFLAGTSAMLAGPALAAPPAASLVPMPRPGDLGRRALPDGADLIADARLGGKVVYAVADARTGEMLEAQSPLYGLPPASTVKAITAAYGLAALGRSHRFVTRLIATGPIREGRLEGDLILAGGGDPTLDSDDLAGMASALKAAGVSRVAGRLLVHGGGLPEVPSIDPTQPDHLSYNPAVWGLNLNYNRVHFQWKREGQGYELAMLARARDVNPEVGVARMQVVDRKLPVYTYEDGGARDHWTVARRALGKGGSRWLPVRKLDRYAGEVLRKVAGERGVSLPAPQPWEGATAGTVLVELDSPPLERILRDMMRWSTNLTAEVVGLAATRASGGQPATLAHSAAAMSDWMRAEFGASRPVLLDHSGLSDGSRLRAHDMVRMLVKLGPDSVLGGLMKPIPLRNSNGKPIPNHPIAVRAKTGTLNFVSGLAGFMTGASGRELAFAIFAADLGRREAIPRADRERPEGARPWNRRSKVLQQELIERWGRLYAA